MTVTNIAATPNGGIVRLRASKKVAVGESTRVNATVDPNGIDALGKMTAIPPGGTAKVTLRTSVNGFEEGISLSGTVESIGTDGKPATSRSDIMVSTGRFATI